MRTDPRPRAALVGMARKSLTRWAANYAQRDELVRLAAASGLGVNEITRITGLAKTTVIRILRPAAEDA
jgi:DNA invertase Pin-like site-specific DNA recombinase